MIDVRSNAIIILHPCYHTVVQSDFALFPVYLAGVDDSFCLFFQLLPLVLQILISDMRHNHEFIAFSVYFHFETKELRIMISHVDYPCFLF